MAITTMRRIHIKDFALYALFGITVLGAIVTLSISGTNRDPFVKWDFSFFYTPVIFAILVEESRPLWKNRRFWLFTGLLLLIHCIAVTIIFFLVDKPNPLYMLIGLAEIVFLLPFIRRILRPTPSRR